MSSISFMHNFLFSIQTVLPGLLNYRIILIQLFTYIFVSFGLFDWIPFPTIFCQYWFIKILYRDNFFRYLFKMSYWDVNTYENSEEDCLYYLFNADWASHVGQSGYFDLFFFSCHCSKIKKRMFWRPLIVIWETRLFAWRTKRGKLLGRYCTRHGLTLCI